MECSPTGSFLLSALWCGVSVSETQSKAAQKALSGSDISGSKEKGSGSFLCASSLFTQAK